MKIKTSAYKTLLISIFISLGLHASQAELSKKPLAASLGDCKICYVDFENPDLTVIPEEEHNLYKNCAIRRLACDHYFHEHCLRGAMQGTLGNNCPMRCQDITLFNSKFVNVEQQKERIQEIADQLPEKEKATQAKIDRERHERKIKKLIETALLTLMYAPTGFLLGVMLDKEFEEHTTALERKKLNDRRALYAPIACLMYAVLCGYDREVKLSYTRVGSHLAGFAAGLAFCKYKASKKLKEAEEKKKKENIKDAPKVHPKVRAANILSFEKKNK